MIRIAILIGAVASLLVAAGLLYRFGYKAGVTATESKQAQEIANWKAKHDKREAELQNILDTINADNAAGADDFVHPVIERNANSVRVHNEATYNLSARNSKR
jgi:hypothetical protein